MSEEQINQIILAMNKMLDPQKDIYDYFIIILPILTGVIAWVASSFQARHTFRRSLKKDIYYKTKENTKAIVSDLNDFCIYIYNFYKTVKNNYNNGLIVFDDNLDDFITTYSIKLSYIYQNIKIERPFKVVDIKKISENLRIIEERIKDMNQKLVSFYDKNKNIDNHSFIIENQELIKKFNDENNIAIEEIINVIAKIQNEIVDNLMIDSLKLGITSEKDKKNYNSKFEKKKAV